MALGNLAAVYYGWTDYYAYQFSVTPGYLWPLVSDSPNAVLLFAAALVLFRFRIQNRWLDAAAFVANVKVGLWTVFVLLYYYEDFFDRDPVLRWFLFWLHVGMAGQAFVLFQDLRRHQLRGGGFAVLAAVFLIHDVVDYSLGTHPILPRSPDAIVVATTVALTVLSLALVLVWFVRWPNQRTAAP